MKATVGSVLLLSLCGFPYGASGPLELHHPEEDQSHFDFTDGEIETINIVVTGFPAPKYHSLDKITPSGKLELKSLKVKELLDYASPYHLVITESNENSWYLILTFYYVKVADGGRYQFEVGNGIGKDLIYTFDISVSEDKKSSDKIGVVVGGIITAMVVVVLVTILVINMFLRRKDTQKKQHASRKKNFLTEEIMSGYQANNVPRNRTQHEDIGVQTTVNDINSGNVYQDKAKTGYENIDMEGENDEQVIQKKEHASRKKNSMTKKTMSDSEDIHGPENRTQHEEIDVPATVNDINSSDVHKGYVYHEYLEIRQRQSSSDGYEHAYNVMELETYDTTGALYERICPRAKVYEGIHPSFLKLAMEEDGNTNVTLVSSDTGSKG